MMRSVRGSISVAPRSDYRAKHVTVGINGLEATHSLRDVYA